MISLRSPGFSESMSDPQSLRPRSPGTRAASLRKKWSVVWKNALRAFFHTTLNQASAAGASKRAWWQADRLWRPGI